MDFNLIGDVVITILLALSLFFDYRNRKEVDAEIKKLRDVNNHLLGNIEALNKIAAQRFAAKKE